jgi:hypothetical protein
VKSGWTFDRVIECVQIMLEVENLRIPRQRSALFADSPRWVPASFSYLRKRAYLYTKYNAIHRPETLASSALIFHAQNHGGDSANAGRLPEGV